MDVLNIIVIVLQMFVIWVLSKNTLIVLCVVFMGGIPKCFVWFTSPRNCKGSFGRLLLRIKRRAVQRIRGMHSYDTNLCLSCYKFLAFSLTEKPVLWIFRWSLTTTGRLTCTEMQDVRDEGDWAKASIFDQCGIRYISFMSTRACCPLMSTNHTNSTRFLCADSREPCYTEKTQNSRLNTRNCKSQFTPQAGNTKHKTTDQQW